MSERYRRELRCTIADFSYGRMPTYTIDKFPTPEGTLGITLFPEVEIGSGKDKSKTKNSTNIYWFCKHLEESGWLVKECFISNEPPTFPPKVEKPANSNEYVWSINLYSTIQNLPRVFILVRKVDETDVEESKRKKK